MAVTASPTPAVRPPVDDVTGFLRQREGALVARGYLRRDDGRDIRVSAAQLAEIYTQVALTDEYQRQGTGFVAQRRASLLRRWEQPVRLQLEFGASQPTSLRLRDRSAVSDLAARLTEAARHPVILLPEGAPGANFHVLVLTEAERRAIGNRLRALVPGIDAATVSLVENLPLSVNCLALAFSRSGTSVYSDALAIVRAEHPDLSRTACYHEEITQGLGLASDSPAARPSIFNDADEFAVVTWHDLALLRLHYDPRLRPGMTTEQALPLIRTIATELVGGES
jgi:hypothetical protein